MDPFSLLGDALANELTPSDLINIHKMAPAGFITRVGTIHSHTSILIRNLGVPAVTDILVQNDG